MSQGSLFPPMIPAIHLISGPPGSSLRLLHNLSLVALGLPVGHETWPLIGLHRLFVISWFKYRLGWPQSQWIMGSCDKWEFLHFFRSHWVPLHNPNGRQSACRSGCARRLWDSLWLSREQSSVIIPPYLLQEIIHLLSDSMELSRLVVLVCVTTMRETWGVLFVDEKSMCCMHVAPQIRH